MVWPMFLKIVVPGIRWGQIMQYGMKVCVCSMFLVEHILLIRFAQCSLLLVLSPSGRTQHVCFPPPSYAKVKTHPLLADQIDSPSSMVPWSSVRFLGSHCHHRMPGSQERKEFFHFVTDMCWFHLTGAVSKCSRNMKMKCSKEPTASLLSSQGPSSYSPSALLLPQSLSVLGLLVLW